MKVALCFSGQPRFINECSESIIKNVIRNYDVDVFGHFWFSPELLQQPYKFGGDGGWKDQRIESDAIHNFNVKYNTHPDHVITEPPKQMIPSFMKDNFEKSQNRYWPHSLNEELEPNFKNWRINATLSNFYSMFKVNELRSLYEFEKNIEYDWVIKCRTDVYVHTPLILENYDLEVFNCTSLMQQPPQVNDWICWGSSGVMSSFMSVFSSFRRAMNLTKYFNDGCWDNETLHKTMLDAMQIEIVRHPVQLSVPRF